MTAEEKLWLLIQTLVMKTAQGAVVWEATAAKNAYQASFPEYGVRIVESQRPDYSDPTYLLEVLDGNGKVIERADNTDVLEAVPQAGIQARRTMRDLYNTARRHALSVDTALDSLLSELEKAS